MMRPEFDLSRRLALTVPEAAVAIGVSERHLRAMLPEVPHCRVGGRVVIPVEPLREWLRARTEAEKASSDQAARKILDELAR